MAKLSELLREHTTLDRDQVGHLNRLVSEWGMLADFCFSDLMLYVPTTDGRWGVVAQVRPATGQTMYHTDFVGAWASESEMALLDKALSSGQPVEGEITSDEVPPDTHLLAIPVAYEGKPIAVLSREWIEQGGRRQGELERAYWSI
ncbi:MAG: histidine kinase N-terminal domain-containing protein, partial [Ilumatobacter fluminis]